MLLGFALNKEKSFVSSVLEAKVSKPGRPLNEQTIKIILRVFASCKEEQRKGELISPKDPKKRTALYTGVRELLGNWWQEPKKLEIGQNQRKKREKWAPTRKKNDLKQKYL